MKKLLIAALIGMSSFFALDLALAPSTDIKVTYRPLDEIVTARMVDKKLTKTVTFAKPTAAPTPTPEGVLKYYGKEITEADKEILLRITEAEAGEGTKENKKNVLTCIMNRVLSDEWPDTIEGVVFQKNQFSPITDGGYEKAVVEDSTREAYEEWLHEGLGHTQQFFCMPNCYSAKHGWFSHKKIVFNDGLHNFYD